MSPAALTSVHHRQGDAAARWIGAAASHALLGELACYPKPGLVSFVDSGAHRDMDAGTFLASIEALRNYFVEIAQAGLLGADFPVLQVLGIEAERVMLAATGGINTHRGAIFSLGLLAAAAGRLIAMGRRPSPHQLLLAVPLLWGEALMTAPADAGSHGGLAARRYGAGGARAEAAAGFPVVRGAVLPAMEAARRRGGDPNDVAVEGFFASLATLEDTNLLYRGGRSGLDWSRGAAAAWQAAGGITAPEGQRNAVRLHEEHISRHLSPGGSADMLSAALFLERIGR